MVVIIRYKTRPRNASNNCRYSPFQRLLVERLSIGLAIPGAVQVGEILYRLRDIGVIGAERFLPDRQCLLV